MFGKSADINRARIISRGAYLQRVTEDILVAMEDHGITKAELARRLGKSKARISQLLSGGSNMTIGTLSDIAFELGLTLDKTFREYSAQRYRISEQEDERKRFTDSTFAVDSIRNVKAMALASLSANESWSERESITSNVVQLKKSA